ncbi:MAG: hypothetical protein K6E29_03640 [Cyanobacteria bacterium RUI128]|nr:hypothetical protein [Cyanobacteria bacterium RUI128]
MKKIFLLLLIIVSMGAGSVFADDLPIKQKLLNSKPTYANKYSVVRFFQDHVYYANQNDLTNFLKLYAPVYVSNDGFNMDSTRTLFTELWKQYSGIHYKNKVNSVAFYGDTAVVNVSEVASAAIASDNKKGELKSCVDVIYYLQRKGKSWVITGENVISEEILITWGDAKSVAMFLETPQLVGAGDEYSAKLYIAPPNGIFAIGSISSEIVSYPQKSQKDVFKKFAQDYSLERILMANTKNTNEYVVASIGYSRPTMSSASGLNMNLSGYACLIRRVNVVPKNNYIEVKSDTKQAK